MKRYAFMVIGAAAMLALLSPAALAQNAPQGPPCGDRKALVELLVQQLGQVPVAAGVQPHGTVLEVFVSPKTNDWAMLLTLPGDSPTVTSCLVGAGKAWKFFAIRTGGETAAN